MSEDLDALKTVTVWVRKVKDGWTIEVDSELDPWSTHGILAGAFEQFEEQLYGCEEDDD